MYYTLYEGMVLSGILTNNVVNVVNLLVYTHKEYLVYQ